MRVWKHVLEAGCLILIFVSKPWLAAGNNLIAGSGSFSGQATLSVPGSTQVTTLTGTIDLIVNVGVSSARGAREFIDPYLTIDPTWAASHPGFTMNTEPGIGHGAVSTLPGPSAWITFAAAMAMFGTCLRRRFALRARGRVGHRLYPRPNAASADKAQRRDSAAAATRDADAT